MKKERNSNFELLRIIAMLFIVIYHLLITVYSKNPTEIIYKGAWIPLHIGVILFVFISGYFGIKCTVNGICKLVGTIALYYLPLTIYGMIEQGGDFDIKQLLFISYSPYWFIKTYLYLYLFSPVLNNYLDKINNKDRLILICSLAFISIYIGSSLGDSSLTEGKNLINFSLLYVLGNTFKVYEKHLRKIPSRYLICAYIILNCGILYTFVQGGMISKIIWFASFPYCSPLLIINAGLFFLIFSRLKLKSQSINYIASSMFAVYLLHCQPYVANRINVYLSYSLVNDSIILNFCTVLLYAVIIMAISVIIDKILLSSFKRICRCNTAHKPREGC